MECLDFCKSIVKPAFLFKSVFILFLSSTHLHVSAHEMPLFPSLTPFLCTAFLLPWPPSYLVLSSSLKPFLSSPLPFLWPPSYQQPFLLPWPPSYSYSPLSFLDPLPIYSPLLPWPSSYLYLQPSLLPWSSSCLHPSLLPWSSSYRPTVLFLPSHQQLHLSLMFSDPGILRQSHSWC